MDDDRDEDDDGWCDTVDDSCEKDMESVEWGWHISEEVDSRGGKISSKKSDLWF